MPNKNLDAFSWISDTRYGNSSDILEFGEQHIRNLNSSYANIINLSNNLGHSENPEIVTNGSNVYALWLDDTNGNIDIYFRRSVDNGSTFGETVNLSNNPGGSLNPTMVASRNTKNLYVVWEHIPGNNGEIFFTRSTDNGATFGTPIKIGNNTGLNGFPQVALSETNSNVHVVWHDSENGVMLRRSTDNGATFGKPIILSDENVDSQNPQIAISDDNNVYVAWQSNPQGRNGEIVFTRSTDNGSTFGKPISVTNENGSMPYNGSELIQNNSSDRKKQNILSFHPRLVSVPESKKLYVIWYSGFNVFHKNYHLLTDIYFTRSTDNGATFGKPISLTNYSVWAKSTDNGVPFVSPISLSGYSGWAPEPQIAISDDNNVYVAWQSNPQGRNGEISFAKSTDSGATFETPIILSDKSVDSQNPQIAISQDNNAYLVWNNNATGNEEIMLHKASPKNMDLISPNSIQKETDLPNNTTRYLPTMNPKRIALVERTFTDAAYDKSLYLFYNIKHNQSSNITKYTNLFSSKVIKQHSILPEFEIIVNHLKWLTPQSNVTILTDADVHDNPSLFMHNGTIKYDVVILGHNEYVTQLEYNNLRQFVASGGLLILLDGNVVYAEVKYDKENQTITLVKGHRWEFDGTFGLKSIDERWPNETTEWIGSNYCECHGDDIRFGNNPFGVRHNEEQYITNPGAKIILDYHAYNVSKTKYLPRDFKIATYELDYEKGKVITLGLFTDDALFNNDKFKKFFDSLLYYYLFREQNPQLTKVS